MTVMTVLEGMAPPRLPDVTPDVWSQACAVCTRHFSLEEMAPIAIYPVGVCNECYQRSRPEPVFEDGRTLEQARRDGAKQ